MQIILVQVYYLINYFISIITQIATSLCFFISHLRLKNEYPVHIKNKLTRKDGSMSVLLWAQYWPVKKWLRFSCPRAVVAKRELYFAISENKSFRILRQTFCWGTQLHELSWGCLYNCREVVCITVERLPVYLSRGCLYNCREVVCITAL